MFDYPKFERVACGAMLPEDLRRELERLAREMREARARLGELGVKIRGASELVATIRSTLRGAAEGTPAVGDAQGEARIG